MTDEKIIELIRSRLDEYRFIHSLAVADEAERLAEKYGCDIKKAKTAGLLHDIMKNDSKENMLAFAQEHRVIMTDVEKREYKLWHAILGAVYIKDVLKIEDDDIINAVRYHTTARANMSLLEKVIYLADFTSADRTYQGVEDMRKWVDIDLDKAMMTALEFSIEELLHKGACIHPDTLNVYNEIKLKDEEGLL